MEWEQKTALSLIINGGAGFHGCLNVGEFDFDDNKMRLIETELAWDYSQTDWYYTEEIN